MVRAGPAALLALTLVVGLAVWAADAAPAGSDGPEPTGPPHEVREAGPASSFLPVLAAVIVWRLLCWEP